MKTLNNQSKNDNIFGEIYNFIQRKDNVPYVFDILIVVAVLLLFVYPLLYGIYSSFITQEGFSLDNYFRLFDDRIFYASLYVTFSYVILYTVGIMIIGFITGLAIDISEKNSLPGAKILSSLLTLPYAIPDVVGALIWLWMLNPRRGVINYLLNLIGLGSVDWLVNSDIALITVTMVSVWRLFPMHTLIIMAAFRTVPQNLYEAAEIDGATILQEFFYITIPSIWNIIKFLILLTVVWSFKRFTMLWLLTEGGPRHATETLSLKIYKEAFQFYNKNYASATAVILLIIVAILSFIYVKYTKLEEREEGGSVI